MRSQQKKPCKRGYYLLHLALVASSGFPMLAIADVVLPTLPAIQAGGVVAPQVLSLGEARQLALQKQPNIQAAQSGIAAAQAKVRGLGEVPRLAAVLRKDLPIRCQQANLGIKAAESRLRQAEIETLYSVTRLYWSAVHAKQQLRLLEENLEEPPTDWKTPKDPGNLSKFLYIQKFVNNLEPETLDRDTGRWSVKQLDIMKNVLLRRREEAKSGYQKALAALREAIGIEAGAPIEVADSELPQILAEPTRQQAVDLALHRRSEIEQLGLALQVTELEAEAQSLIHGSKGETFATGSDLHAISIQTSNFGDEYKPGALGVEMPATLVGPACVRQEQARIFAERNRTALTKARGLVALDAEFVFLQFRELASQLEHAEKAAALSKENIRNILKDLVDNESKGRVSELFLALQTRATLLEDLNRIRFQMLLNYISLERTTAGGFVPSFGPAIQKAEVIEKKPETAEKKPADNEKKPEGEKK